MKKVWTIAALALAVCLLGGSAWAQLVGGTTYPINGTSNPPTSFATLLEAVTYLNANGVSGTGDIVLELQSGYTGTEASPITMTAYAGADASRPVIIRPATGFSVTTTVPGAASPNQHAIALNGCSYVTLDGRAGGTGTTRDWSVYCTGSGTSGLGQMAVRLNNTSASMTGINVRYLNMRAETGSTTGAVFQITGNTTNTISSVVIENNFITSTADVAASTRGYGVTLAVASNTGNAGIVFRNNEITQFYARGINITGGFPGLEVYGNQIHHTAPVTQPTTVEFSAIYFSTTASGGAKIYGNFIYDIQLANGTTAVNGIYTYNGNTAGNRVQFFNNFVALGPGIALTTLPIYGIRDYSAAGALFDIFYNSVFIGGSPAAGTSNSAAFYKQASNNIDLRNNVFYNARSNNGATGTHWAISVTNTTFTAINNNDYFADGNGGVLGTTTGAVGGNVTTLAAWQAVVTTDLASVSLNPAFEDPTASPPDLHINTSRVTLLESGASPTTGINADYDGDGRNVTTPDIGADEFAGTYGDPTPPAISYTPLTNTLSTASPRTFDNVDISDADGVNTTAGTRPRCYFKKYSQANAYNDNTSSTDGWKWVEADGSGGSPFTFYLDYTLLYGGTGVSSGDTVQYFVIAQDASAYTNVGINSGTFAAYPASVALTAAAFPVGGTIRSYLLLMPPMHGDYTVGLTDFNRATGLNLTVSTETRRVTREVRYLETENPKSAQAPDALPEWKTRLVEVDEQRQVLLRNGKTYDGPLGVEAKDGSKGVYATLTAAVADMNARGIDGAVRFLLNDASYTTETLPIVVNSVAGASSSNTITIRPNTGVTASISGASAGGPVIKVFNTNYVTIDGSNAGGVDRNLTIANTSATSPNVAWIGSQGTTPITNATLKNCVLVNGVNTSSAVVIGGGTAVGDSGYFNTVTLENCAIQNAYIGSYARGYNGVETASMLVYLNNDLSASGASAIRYIGLYCQGVNGAVIQGNTIANFNGASGEDDKGIWMASATKNAMCHENRIYNLNYTGTGGYGAHGIYVSSATAACNDAVYNNLIYNLSGDGWNYTTIPTDNPIGIVVSGTQDGVGIYFNSINLYGSTLNQASAMSTGIFLNTGSVADIRDNNIVNNLGLLGATGYGSCGVYAVTANTQFAGINYNDYYVNPAGTGVKAIGKITSANTAVTLAEWQALTAQDANSLNADPLYGSNSDLRINIGSPAYHAGTPIGSITTDFIGALRDVATPSMGAYEEVVDLTPPAITYTSPADGATDVLVNAPVIVAFSEPIDTATLFYTSTPNLTATHVWNATNDTVTVTITDFVPATSYLFQVTAANDLAGNPLAAGAVPNPWTFTTHADGTPPSIVWVTPSHGATDVPLEEPIIIAFSEPMDTSSFNGYTDPFHDFTPTWNAAGDTFSLVPQYPYAYNSTMSVIITAGTDLAGYSLPDMPDTAVYFTTIANQGPAIEVVQMPGDTYDGAGPFLVRAVITDPAKKLADGGKQGVATTNLIFTTGTGWTAFTGTPGVADTFDFPIPGPFSPGTVISYYVYAEDDEGDWTVNPANAPIGTYQFRVLDPLPPSNLAAQAGDMMVELDWAPPAQELDYATAPNWVWNGLVSGFIGSVRYTPQHYSCKLEQVVSLWYNGGPGMDSVIVHVWGDDGTGMPDESNQLVTPFAIMPLEFPNYTVVDLSAHDIIISSGEFHVGYELRTVDQPLYVSDNTAPTLVRSLYYWPGDGWYGDLGFDWNQSAVVSYGNYMKGLALKSSHLPRGKAPNYRMDGKGLKPEEIVSKQAPVYGKLTGALAMAKQIDGIEILRGDAPGGPYTTSLGMTINLSLIDGSVSNGSTYYYVARAVYSTPDTFSAYSNEATATPAAMPILLVDDDCSQVGWPDRQAIYTAALDGAGYTGQYTVYETDGTVAGANGPSSGWFANRSHVIWFSGGNWEDQNTLTPTDEANLAAYLDGGGRLFYCAQDYIWDRYPSAGNFSAGQFPYDYLGLASADQDAIMNPYNIAGVTGSLAEGLSYGVIEDPEVGTFADDLTKRSVAGTYDVLDVTAKVGEKTGVAYDNGTFRTVFFTTLFEDITDGANTKAELMYRILNWMSTGVESGPVAESKPTVFSLAANYPNPVRNSTTIRFGLPKESQVRVEVYNIAGQRVKTLASGKLGAGYHNVTWKGANENGQKVAAGVYLVRMVTPEFSGTRKMTVIR